MPIQSINPATGQTLKTFEEYTPAQVEGRLGAALEAFQTLRTTSFSKRAEWLGRLAQILEDEKDSFARTMTLEMGKPIAAAVAEAQKCAWVCRYYAENAAQFLADEEISTNAARSLIHYEPLGPVLAIMPWNFPFWQVFRFAAPALMAGNTALLKHAPNVPQCALVIEDIFTRAGFPHGAFQALLIEEGRVAGLLDDARVKAVTLTGSVPAGSQVASQAGKRIKKSVLELGGSDPFIVMPSADLERAIATAVTARTINNGQSCIAAKRFIVHADVYAEFERRFLAGMQALRVGDPLDPNTQIGPLARPAILQGLHAQVQASLAQGARLLLGGQPIQGPGNYYPPTVLADIPPGSPAAREELFGPVAALFRVEDLDQAIRTANDTNFGLGASAWTRDPREQGRFIDELQAGSVFINGMVASDPRLPFGGVKASGYGRELSAFGIREFVNIKTVWIGE
jgi:succinate-semialdehyde dehydrogenase/glutarate-semialdehyde dehydrogenase